MTIGFQQSRNPHYERKDKMIKKLASSLGRKDQEPNIELAYELAKTENKAGIADIVKGLNAGDTRIAGDCIKVLYEIGRIAPALISDHCDIFLLLLKSRNNRLVWGAMTALSFIASLTPEKLFKNLDTILGAYEKGSVITVDMSISVFAELAQSGPHYKKKVFPILIRHLETCRPKEVAQHSERASVCIDKDNVKIFTETLLKRYGSLAERQKKRIDKLLKKLDKAI
jgi:hypothetical protein